jgi:hypothetical protein
MIQRYKPSGQYGLPAVLGVIPLAAMLIAVGWLYQWVMKFVVSFTPKLGILVVLGFGFASFVAARATMKATHCRHVGVGSMIGAAAAAIAIILTYYFKSANAIAYGAASDPGRLLAWVWDDARGLTPGSTTNLHPAMVLALWITEAIIVVFFGFLGGWAGARAPYCDGCGRWADRVRARFSLGVAPDEAERIKNAREAEELLSVRFLPLSASSLHVAISDCGKCGGMTTVEVRLQTQKINRGRASPHFETLYRDVLLSQEQADRLSRLAANGKDLET